MNTTLTSVLAAIPAATGTNATMVPTDVPIEREIKHEAKKIPASNKFPGSNRKVRFTVASIAPIAWADWAKAPARMKIQIISMMFLLAAPEEY